MKHIFVKNEGTVGWDNIMYQQSAPPWIGSKSNRGEPNTQHTNNEKEATLLVEYIQYPIFYNQEILTASNSKTTWRRKEQQKRLKRPHPTRRMEKKRINWLKVRRVLPYCIIYCSALLCFPGINVESIISNNKTLVLHPKRKTKHSAWKIKISQPKSKPLSNP